MVSSPKRVAHLYDRAGYRTLLRSSFVDKVDQLGVLSRYSRHQLRPVILVRLREKRLCPRKSLEQPR